MENPASSRTRCRPGQGVTTVRKTPSLTYVSTFSVTKAFSRQIILPSFTFTGALARGVISLSWYTHGPSSQG